MLANRRRDEEATIRGRQRHEITPAYRLLVVPTWQEWQLHAPKRENSREKVQNAVTDSTRLSFVAHRLLSRFLGSVPFL